MVGGPDELGGAVVCTTGDVPGVFAGAEAVPLAVPFPPEMERPGQDVVMTFLMRPNSLESMDKFQRALMAIQLARYSHR